MPKMPKPPETFTEFQKAFPKIAQGWELLTTAGQTGPLDAKTQKLVKLGIAIGAMREGALHSAVRKALASGVTVEEVNQALALAATTIGLPSTVAVYSWVRDVVESGKR